MTASKIVEEVHPAIEYHDPFDDKVEQYLNKVGTVTYPERNLKADRVPQWPEGVIHRHEPIELSLGKIYPNQGTDRLVSQE